MQRAGDEQVSWSIRLLAWTDDVVPVAVELVSFDLCTPYGVEIQVGMGRVMVSSSASDTSNQGVSTYRGNFSFAVSFADGPYVCSRGLAVWDAFGIVAAVRGT